MKRYFLLLIWVCLPICAMAQGEDFNKMCDNYENRKGVESVNISPKAFSFLVSDSNKDEKALFNKMKLLRIISVSGKDYKSTADSLNADVLSFLKKNDFQQIMKMKDDKERLYMFNKPQELIFLSVSDEEVAVIYINGTIDEDLIKAVAEGQIKIESE